MSEDSRERIEAFAENFERLIRELIDEASTIKAKSKALDAVERMIDEYDPVVENLIRPH